MIKNLLALSTIGICLSIGLSLSAEFSTEEPEGYRITILSTMLSDAVDDLDAYSTYGEWGFAALVEMGGTKLLYDTGYHPDLVYLNAEKLGVDLSDVEQVILSHAHIDHIGGLMSLRNRLMKDNPKALSVAHIGAGFLAEWHDPNDPVADRNRAKTIIEQYENSGGNVVLHTGPTELLPGVWLSGPVPRRHDEKNWDVEGSIHWNGKFVEDYVPEDMALYIDSPDGTVVLTGCAHAGIINILDYALAVAEKDSVDTAVGGFHLFNAEERVVEWTAQQFRRVGIRRFLAAHCTGIESAHVLREIAGLTRNDAIVGAVGQQIYQDGLYPGWIAE